MHATTANHSHFHHASARIPSAEMAGPGCLPPASQRMRLDQLDDHLLRDIGVDRRTAYGRRTGRSGIGRSVTAP